jgi:hypothetical protein
MIAYKDYNGLTSAKYASPGWASSPATPDPRSARSTRSNSRQLRWKASRLSPTSQICSYLTPLFDAAAYSF